MMFRSLGWYLRYLIIFFCLIFSSKFGVSGGSINMRIFGDSGSFINIRILMIQGVSINMRIFGDSGGFNKYENTYSGGLSLCHTLWFSNPYSFATQCLKYQRFTQSVCNDIGRRKFEFLAKIQFLYVLRLNKKNLNKHQSINLFISLVSAKRSW